MTTADHPQYPQLLPKSLGILGQLIQFQEIDTSNNNKSVLRHKTEMGKLYINNQQQPISNYTNSYMIENTNVCGGDQGEPGADQGTNSVYPDFELLSWA